MFLKNKNMKGVELYKGDCLKYMKSMSNKSIDLIITDPPYDVDVNHDGGKLYAVKNFTKSNVDLVDLKIDNGYDIETIGDEIVRIMKNINVYFWCNKKQIPDYFNYYVNKLGCKFEIICWHKPNALPTYKNKYLSDTEYCLYFRKNGYCDPSQTGEKERYENAKTYYMAPINSDDKKKYGHPTIKPLPIIERMIKNSTKTGDVVFDCFMGSGTTGVAAVKNGRSFIGCEIDENYFEVAKKRIMEVSDNIEPSGLF
jgi:site-specific DNA-methyltransferase (adenine-specific)